MNPQRFRQTQQLFDQAMLRPPPERDAFLAETCGSDDLMRDQVTRMIGYTRENDGALPAALGLSPSTVKRDWRFARAWLIDEVTQAGPT